VLGIEQLEISWEDFYAYLVIAWPMDVQIAIFSQRNLCLDCFLVFSFVSRWVFQSLEDIVE
jgi:hypothetical protein